MNQQTTIIVVAALIVVGIVIILLRRAGRGSFNLPGGFSAQIEGEQAGASIDRNEVRGSQNRMTATGEGSQISKNDVDGDGNIFETR